ncbi:TPA: phage tail tape measure protein [Staphylococcus aureus]|nr:phage tail tape measure protein [Staphylococcus aureus]
MNEKVEGMTLELKLDHLGVQECMKGLKRQLGVVNSEMKANLSAFDKSEKSMEKYQARIKGLNDRLKVQKKMYSQVEDELKQVNANYQKAKSSVKDVEKAYLKLVEANKKEKLALDKSKEALKSSNTELKKAENQYKRTNQRKQDAYQKLKQLRDAEQKLKNSNQATTAQLKRASDAVQKQSAKHKALVEQYKQEGNQVQKLKVQNDNLSKSNDKIESSYAKTNTKLKQTEKEFNDLNNTIKNHSANVAKAETAVNKEKAALNNLERSIDKASSEMKTFNKEQMIAQSHFGKLASQADVMSKKFSSIGDKMTSLGRTMTMGVSTPITLGLGAALKTSADFEGQMSRVGAIAQASSKDLKSMSNQAVDLGAKTSKSANEVAKGDDLLKVGVNKFKGFMQTMGTASKKASDTVKVLGKGVSKETEKALEKYVHYSEENSRIMEKVRLNSGQISEDKAKKLLKIETDLSNNLIAEIEKRNKKELEKTQELIDKYSAFDEQEKQNILTRTKEKNDLRIKKEQELNQKIKELKEKALSDGQISENERKEIEKLENQRRDITVKELSKTEKEQERILVRMQRNRNAYSIDEASKAIKEAEKARKARKKEVDKQYEDDVIAIKNNVNLSKSEKDKLLAIADQRHKDEVRKAKSKKDAVVDVVKKQNKDIDKEMDLSSGRVYKNTEKWWNGLKSWWSNFREDQKKKSDKYAKEQEETARRNRENIKKWFGNAWDGVKSKTGEAFSKMGRNANHFGGEMKKMWSGIKGIPSKLSSGWSSAKSSVGYHTKAIANSTGKWFGKAWQSVKSTTGSIYNQTKQKYSDASDKAWAHSKSIWRGTSKWFSNAYKSAKGWLTDMANKSRAKWDNISSTAWSNAKSVWKGTSKWFSNSYKSLKDWTGDMYSRAHDRFDAISSSAWSNAKSVFNGFRKWLSKTYDWIRDIGKDMGRAAADLGKNVANKAIGGLNSMIGGINKISKAITDKNLIKPIPTLSTGTLAGKGVATDNSGALTQPTFAVLNDRGSGNAPGGGVQEVIHRADGTFHAPQGRDVVVPLGVGDSVINANDTLKLQRMGVLPKFHGGTKKKDWLDQLKGNIGKKAGEFGATAKNTAHNIKKGAEEMVEAAGDKIKDGASWLGDKIGDVWDYVQHPGKLVNKVMSGLNINFGGGANATVKIAKGAYSLLKKKLVDKVKSWFEDFGGGGDGSYLFEYPIWQRFGRYTGGLNFNGGRHYGIDFGMPSGTNVYAVKGGIADKVWTDYGGGNSIQIKTGANEWNWYMHLSKQLARQGQRIKAGQLIGKSGATGNFVRGAHLHFQLMQGSHPGNDTAKDPEKWLKSLKGSGVRSGSGVNKAASAWAGDIRRAAKRMGVNVTSGDVGNIISLIQHESGGNAGITQSSALRDINVLQGNPAKGLLQYIPQTFRHYAVRGHNNIYSGYDQLLAFFNNRYWRSQFNPRGGWSPSGPRRYANGGLITKHQLAEVGEGDKQEMVIPLTRRKRAIQLTEQVMRIIGMDGKPNNITVNNDTSTVEKLLKQIVMLSDKGNKLTDALIQTVSSQDNNLGSNDAIRGLEKILSKQSGHRANANNYMGGLTN